MISLASKNQPTKENLSVEDQPEFSQKKTVKQAKSVDESVNEEDDIIVEDLPKDQI